MKKSIISKGYLVNRAMLSNNSYLPSEIRRIIPENANLYNDIESLTSEELKWIVDNALLKSEYISPFKNSETNIVYAELSKNNADCGTIWKSHGIIIFDTLEKKMSDFGFKGEYFNKVLLFPSPFKTLKANKIRAPHKYLKKNYISHLQNSVTNMF